MNQTPDLRNTAKAQVAGELADLLQRVEDVKAELTALIPDGEPAGIDPVVRLASRLVEANEQLVVSAMQAHSDAATAQSLLDEVAQSAGLDPLTSLPNRTLLLDRFAQAIANARRHGSRMAVMFLDLNGFKQINDQLGHSVGDEVLRLTARCLAASIRDADTVGRYGGDEFLILLADLSQTADAAVIADKINAALALVESAGATVPAPTVSIGISVYPDNGLDAGTLIDLADAAMYRAKRHAPGSFAFHGQEPVGEPGLPGPDAPHDPVWAEHEHHFADLREANENLVVAVIDAQELQAAAEEAHRSLAASLIELVRTELPPP